MSPLPRTADLAQLSFGRVRAAAGQKGGCTWGWFWAPLLVDPLLMVPGARPGLLRVQVF